MIKNMTLGSKPSRIPLMLGLLLGIVSAALIVVYLGQGKSDSNGTGGQAAGEMSGIVVAGQNISAGTKITADMVTIKQIPLSDVVQGTFGQAADVVGKVAITDIVSGEQVVNARVLAATDAGQVIHPDALAETVPVSKQSAPCGTPNCGMRALSVSVSPTTAAAGLIRAGDRVDIVAAFQDGSAVTVVTDVEVLALDTDFQRLTGAQDSGSSGALKQGDEKVDATVATVAVWPDEVLKLAAAEDMAKKNQNCAGTLRLSLRHTNQPGTFDVPVGKGACAQAYATAWGIKVD